MKIILALLLVSTSAHAKTGFWGGGGGGSWGSITGSGAQAGPTGGWTGSMIFGNYHMEPSVNAVGNCGASKTVDLSLANVQTITLNAATCVLTLTNPQTGAPYLFKFTEDVTGNRAVTWPGTVVWQGGGSAPNLSGASKVDLIQCVWDGTSYYCQAALADVAPGTWLQSRVTSFTNVPATTTNWGDCDSVSLTAGDWDVTAVVSADLNSATMTLMGIGISTTTGNSATGLTRGDNWTESSAVPVGTNNQSITVPSFRMSLAATTTVYLKCNFTYAVATPQYVDRISAREAK